MRPALFGVIALFVVTSAATLLLTPRSNTFDRMGVDPGSDEHALLGARVFADVCARCHGESGRGMPPKFPALRASALVQSASPAPLLAQIAASSKGSEMPAYGSSLTNEEILAVVNHARGAWGSQAASIRPTDGPPPAEVAALNSRFGEALKARDLDALLACYAPSPRLVRHGGIDAVGVAAVRKAWQGALDVLDTAGARVVRVSLPGARYAAEADRAIFAMGRLYAEVQDEGGARATTEGRFLRVYAQEDGDWRIAFDHAEAPLPGPPQAD